MSETGLMDGRLDAWIVDAARAALAKIHSETGGGDALRPNKTPEYQAALSIWHAVLDAHRGVIHERTKMRFGERKLEVVGAPSTNGAVT